MTNLENFLSKMYQCCGIIEITYPGEYTPETSAIRETLFSMVIGYSGVYDYKLKLKIGEITKVDEPIKYLKHIYEVLKEARSLFVDHWLIRKVDELSEIIAKLLYHLK